MSVTAATTIPGVSILTGQRRGGDVFELALSADGIEIRRPGRPPTRMPWDRVSQWEIEERRGGVLLTLRGAGATTPLVVPGWTLDDLENVMRTTAGAVPDAFPGAVAVAATQSAAVVPPVPSRSERWRQRQAQRRPALSFKAVAAVVLLCLLATAVTLVLLQSAGVISWGFLGPTA